MISRSSSNMGHAGSKTRSQGHLVHFKHLASCPDSNSNSFNPIFTKHDLKLYLDDGLFVKYIFLNTFTISQTGVFCDRLPLLFVDQNKQYKNSNYIQLKRKNEFSINLCRQSTKSTVRKYHVWAIRKTYRLRPF